MDEKQYIKEVRKFGKEYYSILQDFDLNFPKPINLKEEKRKFLKAIADDKVYNPQIKYQKKTFDENKIQELKNFKIDTKNDLYGFKKLYKDRLKTKFAEIECHKNWGDPISTKYVKIYRGAPSRLLVSRAKIFCRRYQRQIVKFRRVSPVHVGEALQDEVFRLTGHDATISFTPLHAKVNINPQKQLIQLNSHERFTTLDVKRLKIHEIGTHYMRYYNGKQFGIKILQTGTSNYIETEEGLAAVMEEILGVSSQAQLFIYAGRVIATHYALKRSFYEVFRILKEYGFKDSDAFAITYRAKRNLCDTSLKGGFTKDYVYFSGYYKVKNFAKKNDLRDLFVGKVTIEDLKVLKKFIDKNKSKIRTILDEEFI